MNTDNPTIKQLVPQEAIEVAVNWWADSLKAPKFDNGDKSETGAYGSLLMGLLNDGKHPNHEQLEAFAKALKELIENSNPSWGDGILLLGVDYHPDRLLSAAAKTANIQESLFSWKTAMWINPKYVDVRAGYSAEIKTIWKLAE